MRISRREFLLGAAATGGLAAAGGIGSVGRALADSAMTTTTAGPRALPAANQSGIEHIVVLCMENRSFDHFLGWVPGAIGRQGGLTYLDDAGQPHQTHHLKDFTGCGSNDPDHSYDGGRVQLNGGACGGFRKGDNDDFALGYYVSRDLPLTTSVVKNFTICDHYFASILGPTYPNRFYTHAAATDRIKNDSTQSTLPTIWDRL